MHLVVTQRPGGGGVGDPVVSKPHAYGAHHDGSVGRAHRLDAFGLDRGQPRGDTQVVDEGGDGFGEAEGGSRGRARAHVELVEHTHLKAREDGGGGVMDVLCAALRGRVGREREGKGGEVEVLWTCEVLRMRADGREGAKGNGRHR